MTELLKSRDKNALYILVHGSNSSRCKAAVMLVNAFGNSISARSGIQCFRGNKQHLRKDET
jgi:hypothetical protein